MGALREVVDAAENKALALAGGPARAQVMVLLAAVLGLDTADKGVVSAIGSQLKDQFALGNTQFGLLLAVVSFATAAATLPMGALVDRICRKNILLAMTGAWALAMVLCAIATSFLFLVLVRVFLGLVTAAAWPAVASLTGDFFPANERAGIYGRILGGELVGAGIGFFISGEVSSFAVWRWSFVAMAAFSIPLGWAIWRFLPEPARGGQSGLKFGETDPGAASGGKGPAASPGDDTAVSKQVKRIARRSHIGPRRDLILHQDPARMPLLDAVRYCLRIPSYRLLIVASALAYYFFSGVRAFAMIYFRQHYQVGHGTISALFIVVGIGALLGVVGGGALAEHLLRQGQAKVRVTLPAIALLACVPFLGFGIWTHSLWLGTLLVTAGVLVLAAAVAPIDAARQDIMHPHLFGRAESGRMAIRAGFEGSAPLLFGAVSGWLGGGSQGLMWTFLIMLSPMIAASLFVLPGRETYLPDVMTAAASVEATRQRADA